MFLGCFVCILPISIASNRLVAHFKGSVGCLFEDIWPV